VRGREQMDATYTPAPLRTLVPDLLGLRQSLGLTQREAAMLLEVAVNTWARWERGELGVHPERARQVRRLQLLVERFGEGPLWGLGVAGLRNVLDGMTVPEALEAWGLDRFGAPKRAAKGGGHG
jgi:transcriptional regulator with XRE-family HTH domain